MEKHNITQLLHVVVFVLLLGRTALGVVSLAQSGEAWDDPNSNLEERFTFTWDSIEFSSKAVNPDTNQDADSIVPIRALDISVNLDILDANDLVALYVDEPQIIEIIDGAGAPVQCMLQEPPWGRVYQRLKWSYGWDGTDIVRRPESWGLTVHVELDPNQPFPSLLSAVRGYVYAMYAEDVIEVDVPFVQTASTTIIARVPVFDPNSGWMDVGYDLQIRVLTAEMACNHVWYKTEVRATGGSMQGLNFRGASDFAAIETQLLGSDNVQHLIDFPSQYARTLTSNSAECSGETGAVSDVGGIRHRIAVHPVEIKIPFEFKNIQVPSAEPVVR